MINIRIRNQTICRAFDTVTNLGYPTGHGLAPYADRTIALIELWKNVLRISSTSTWLPKVLRIRQGSSCEEAPKLLDIVVSWQ